MAKIGNIKLLIAVFLFTFIGILSGTATAQQADIEYYEDNDVTNQVPYFDNRFRIDANLEEVTLLFYRKAGSPPIILVQPDGKKIRINEAKEQGIEWFDDRTFDMIKIVKPMPGPWQAIGSILPKSKIMVMSEVKLHVAPLPKILIQGETIKVTATLANGERAIKNPNFREVITLDVDFYSTNDSAYDNFGAEPIQLATFGDDGYDLDEYAEDGIFTGEFELDFAPGEWLPIYIVKLPMATRKLEQNPVIVRPIPLTLSVVPTKDVNGKHTIVFDISGDYVDPDSIVLQGNVIFPDKTVAPFSVMEGKGIKREHQIPFTEGGVHRVDVRAFGRTVEGREFRLVVPQFSFNIERQPFQTSTANMTDDEKLAEEQRKAEEAEARIRKLEELKAQQIKEAEEKQLQTYIIIGVGNAVVLIFALIIYLVIRRKGKK